MGELELGAAATINFWITNLFLSTVYMSSADESLLK